MITVVLQDGCSPLYAASCNGHLDVVKTLLEAGANINQINKVQKVDMYVFSTIVNMYSTCTVYVYDGLLMPLLFLNLQVF